jgi:hypothetical protein
MMGLAHMQIHLSIVMETVSMMMTVMVYVILWKYLVVQILGHVISMLTLPRKMAIVHIPMKFLIVPAIV